jgi:hypothetical protein
MILLHHISQILAWSEKAGLRESSVVLEGVESQWVRGVLVDGDHTRCERMWGLEHLTEEALSRVGITRGAQHEVQRGSGRVDGPVEVV